MFMLDSALIETYKWFFKNMHRKSIILADDQLIMRAGIRALLDTMPQYRIVAECTEGGQAIEAARRLNPDVVILDIAMPGVDGIEAARRIHQHEPSTKILILSCIDRESVIEQALNAGAMGYLHKEFILDELICALKSILDDVLYLSPKLQDSLMQSGIDLDGGVSLLTPRQIEVLRLVASGQTNKEVAISLGISPKTVEYHRTKIMQRLDVRDVTGMTRYAMQMGIVSTS